MKVLKLTQTKRKYLMTLLIFVLLGHSGFAMNPSISVMEFEAFQQYQMRPDTELSKLIYLMDWFKDADVGVHYNGSHLDAYSAAKKGKGLLQRYYRQESAEDWVRLYTYKSPDGEIIKAQFPDGKKERLRRVFLRELETLDQLTKAA